MHRKDPTQPFSTSTKILVSDVLMKYYKAAISFCSPSEVEQLTFLTRHSGADADFYSTFR